MIVCAVALGGTEPDRRLADRRGPVLDDLLMHAAYFQVHQAIDLCEYAGASRPLLPVAGRTLVDSEPLCDLRGAQVLGVNGEGDLFV